MNYSDLIDFKALEIFDAENFLADGHAIVNSGVVYNIDSVIQKAEEYECLSKVLDDKKVPRYDKNNAKYSLVGRVNALLMMGDE